MEKKMEKEMKKIIFVCMGNICRSPMAETIMKKFVKDKGLEEEFFIDSAGTIDLHQGEDADSRMIDVAENRGYNITSISRWFEDKDFEEFDHIMVMDDNNFQTLLTRTKNPKHIKKIEFITDYRKKFLKNYIPDPYYGGDKGFDNVIDLLEDSCQGFLEKITSNQG